MKVAQYEVLGNNAKKNIRPGSGRDDRSVLAPGPRFTNLSSRRSSRPRPGRIVFLNASTSYWATFIESPGTSRLDAYLSSYVDAHELKPLKPVQNPSLVILVAADRSGRVRQTPHAFSNFVQTAPFFALLTAVAMNAMPLTPSSTLGKSTSVGIGLPATSASIARAASR
jgi:hypothetical protein